MNDPQEYPARIVYGGIEKIHLHRITGSVVLLVRLKAEKGTCKIRFVKLLMNPPSWIEWKQGRMRKSSGIISRCRNIRTPVTGGKLPNHLLGRGIPVRPFP